MPDRATLFLPLPRALAATVRPRRTPELIAAFDSLPVEAESLSSSQAPLVLRRVTIAPHMFASDVRLHDGGFLMPLDLGSNPEGCREADLPRVLADTVEHALAHRHHGDHRHLWDWQAQLRGTGRGRGLVEAATLDLACVDDDGRSAQADLARYLARELVLVDGRVHHRVLTPRYEIYGRDGVGYRALTRTPYPTPWDSGPDRLSVFEFRPDRLDDADAFADALARRSAKAGDPPPSIPGQNFEILEPDLLAAALPADDLPTATTHALAHFARAAGLAVGHLADAGVRSFLDLRALGRNGVPDDGAALDAMERLRALLPEIEAVGRKRDLQAEAREMLTQAAQATRDVLLRHDVIDRPRKLGLPAEDAAILDLAP